MYPWLYQVLPSTWALSLVCTLPRGLRPLPHCPPARMILLPLSFPRLVALLCHLFNFPFVFPTPFPVFFFLSPVGTIYSMYILKCEALAEKVYLLNYLMFYIRRTPA